MAGRKAKLTTRPRFIMSAPRAHYPLFNLVEKTVAYPRRTLPCPSPSWSARNDSQLKRTAHRSGRRPGNGRDVDAGVGEVEEEGVVCGGSWVPVDDTVHEGLPVEFGEISEEDEFFDDGSSAGGGFPSEGIDMNRFCFDDDIGSNDHCHIGGAGSHFLDGLTGSSNLAKTAAQIIVALQKTEEEIRKLEHITRLGRQGSLTREWVDVSKGFGGGDVTGFYTPTTSEESPVNSLKGGCWEDMNTSLAELIHQERMLPGWRTGGARDRKVHFKSSSFSEGEEAAAARLEIQSARDPCHSADDGDLPTPRHSQDFLSEREKAIRAYKMGALSPDDRSGASSPGRPSFTLDESRSGRLFSVEKLNADFSSRTRVELHEIQIRNLAANDIKRRAAAATVTHLQDHAVPATRASSNKQLASECSGCKCIRDNPLAVRHTRRSNLEPSKSFREYSRTRLPWADQQQRRVFTPDRIKTSDTSRRSTFAARPGAVLVAEKVSGSQDSSPFRHERDTLAQCRLDGGASHGSFKDSPVMREKHLHPFVRENMGGSESPFRADKPEPLQVKLAAPQSPLRSELHASPSRLSFSSRGRDSMSSPMRIRARMRVELRFMSPFHLLRKFKEVCTRLILAASSSVKADPVVADPWISVPSRPSTSSSCSFASVAATPARSSCNQANNSPRMSQRRSCASSKACRGSPYVSSPAVSQHSFYSEAISDCIEFIKRSSTPDNRMM